ncbi:hypothetical protein [uncultured Paraglaciecola sp.]|uniref:hypothetical protein n=1 Tax=uncultured Paraglaciecola sp. TaxID=1765024 RepID=UPI002622ED8B|nr:hypothetical protein [uncultured Paraglaciecola sp.]
MSQPTINHATIENQQVIAESLRNTQDVDTDAHIEEFHADIVDALAVIVSAKAASNSVADEDSQYVARLHDGLFMSLVEAKSKSKPIEQVYNEFIDGLEREYLELRGEES